MIGLASQQDKPWNSPLVLGREVRCGRVQTEGRRDCSEGSRRPAHAPAAKRKLTGEEPAPKKKKTASKPQAAKSVTDEDTNKSDGDEEEEDEGEEEEESQIFQSKTAKKAAARPGPEESQARLEAASSSLRTKRTTRKATSKG